jgi:hypothetical protein
MDGITVLGAAVFQDGLMPLCSSGHCAHVVAEGKGLDNSKVPHTIFPVFSPEGAHNAGPGDDECDGVGIDNIEACP